MRAPSLLLTALTPAVVLAALSAQSDRDWQRLDAQVTSRGIEADIRFLADDLLGGRGVATPGGALARTYLATRLRALGIEAPFAPPEEQHSPTARAGYEQPVPILGLTSTVERALQVTAEGREPIGLSAPADYVAWAGHRAETVAWNDAEVVFVGYGIDAPEQDWDDYGDADLTGKVLLFLNDDPDWDPALFAGKTRLYYGRWAYKYEEAARRGAAGALVIHTTPSAGYPFQVIQTQHQKEQFWLPFDDATPTLDIRGWCSDDAATRLCALGGQDLATLRERARSRDFTPIPLGVQASLGLANASRELDTANVVGVLRGSDPELRDEAVVVSAHYDHLGDGPERRGDTIYNGAIDNAAGCAAVLAVAEGLTALDVPPRRSVVFLFPAAEESGLLGAKHYARAPQPFPASALVADYNFDFVNVWGPTEDIQLVGHGKNSLTDVLTFAASRRGRRAEPFSRPDTGMFYRSDHFEFARAGIPSILLSPGDDFDANREGRRRLKAAYTSTRYHTPQDEYDRRWNLDGMVEDVRLVLEAVLRTADAAARPSWSEGDEFADRR